MHTYHGDIIAVVLLYCFLSFYYFEMCPFYRHINHELNLKLFTIRLMSNKLNTIT